MPSFILAEANNAALVTASNMSGLEYAKQVVDLGYDMLQNDFLPPRASPVDINNKDYGLTNLYFARQNAS